jgi:D-alanine-D-alanine ligase-like ATP-grasp enzyme
MARRERLRSERRRGKGTTVAAEAMWRSAAAALGADATRISSTLLEVRLATATTWIAYEQTTPLSDRATSFLASDKPTAYRLLARASVPVPAHVLVARGDGVTWRKFLCQVPPPYLVKPANGTGGGVGVVGHIHARRDLEAALRNVWRYGDVLLEQHLPLPSYRLLLLDGRLLDALRRPLPTVVGDGTTTVADLIEREARRRIACGGDAAAARHLEIDLDCLFTLASSGVRLQTVPAAREVVSVKSATNFAAPEQTQRVAHELHPELVASALKAAASLGVRLAGVDIVTNDASVPLQVSGGVVLEVNPVPGIIQHTLAQRNGGPPEAAMEILAALLQTERKLSASSSGS